MFFPAGYKPTAGRPTRAWAAWGPSAEHVPDRAARRDGRNLIGLEVHHHPPTGTAPRPQRLVTACLGDTAKTSE